MKKIFALLLALVMMSACAVAETVNQKDEPVLNIFSWEGYIDYATVIAPFEQETGIKVNYATFASNEEMFEKLSAVNGGDYDIILASDYIVNTTREACLMQKFEAWENEDLNKAELAYYIDVQARIKKELLEVA